MQDTIFTSFVTVQFWSVQIVNNNKIIFYPADGPDVKVPFVAVTSPDSINTKYNSVNGNTTMDLTIVKKDCNDGMSKETHSYGVSLKTDTIKYPGCGRKAN